MDKSKEEQLDSMLEKADQGEIDRMIQLEHDRELELIKYLESQFEQGQEEVILDLMAQYLSVYSAVPEWLKKEFLTRHNKVRNFECGSWDDVFGAPAPKGTHLSKLRTNMRMAPKIYWRVTELRHQDPELAIDVGLFDIVGKEFGIGKTLASELYYMIDRGINSAKNLK